MHPIMDSSSATDRQQHMDNNIFKSMDENEQQQEEKILSDYHYHHHHRSASMTSGLRRQPTKYPHGLGISVHMVTDEQIQQQHQQHQHKDYSRASTMQSNWDQSVTSTTSSCPNEKSYQHRYSISMISTSDDLAELQVRRYKYPLTGNYYLDSAQESTRKSSSLTRHRIYEYGKRYCRWKYLRWPLTFIASVLLFFGLITYCIWLHDVSVARERYLQRRYQQQNSTPIPAIIAYDQEQQQQQEREREHDQEQEAIIDVTDEFYNDATITTTTERSHRLQESTILRAIGTRTRQRPKEQKLTTLDYSISKGVVAWDKERKDGKQDAVNVEVTTLISEAAALLPTNVRFTSGHQNSFGVPIEDDERILRLINGLQPLPAPATTKASIITKVSPTIPPIATKLKPTSAMSATRTTQQESGCFSTSLPMCLGVLDYDLTYNTTATQLSAADAEDFQQLIQSNCSARAAEFICATLEPECRPLHIGALPPCRRICKAIFEACSIVIANSDVLSELFDCNQYPDSNDPLRCEDPTRRRGYCFDNEFECYDRSCVPQQWKCDNIKDCATGEDEDHCLVCEHPDEFRCRSNEKCIADSLRCDTNFDCFDGSDEEDCDLNDYGGSGDDPNGNDGAAAFDEAALNSFPRIFSYASFLSPNQSNDNLYTYISAITDDESGTKFQVHEITNRTSGVSNEEVTNSVPGEGPKGFVNFRDSKEIMMTSDSENKFKYSAARTNRTGSKYQAPTQTTPLQAAGSQRIAVTTSAPKPAENCASHQLRCVSGKCITVDQLCDRKIDCPDGADELMCVYKVRNTTTNSSIVTSSDPTTIATTTLRSDKRTIRTTTTRRRLRT